MSVRPFGRKCKGFSEVLRRQQFVPSLFWGEECGAALSRARIRSPGTPTLFRGFGNMFSTFRRLVDALEGLRGALETAEEQRAEAGSALERIESLELSRGQWEAEVEAVLMKAEGKLQAANNAEARERTMRKSYEKHVDPFGDEGAEVPEAVPAGDAEGSEEDWVQPLRMDVAEDDKTRALRMKFQ